jgi:hypothetical protein
MRDVTALECQDFADEPLESTSPGECTQARASAKMHVR